MKGQTELLSVILLIVSALMLYAIFTSKGLSITSLLSQKTETGSRIAEEVISQQMIENAPMATRDDVWVNLDSYSISIQCSELENPGGATRTLNLTLINKSDLPRKVLLSADLTGYDNNNVEEVKIQTDPMDSDSIALISQGNPVVVNLATSQTFTDYKVIVKTKQISSCSAGLKGNFKLMVNNQLALSQNSPDGTTKVNITAT